MGGLNKLPDIDAYFANTSLEHLQKVYDDVKDFENTNLCVRDFLNSENQDVFAEKHFDSESSVYKNAESSVKLEQLV